MTSDAAVRQIAQSDPVPQLSTRLGDCASLARQRVDSLVGVLRELDSVRDLLIERGWTIDVDLGPIGNAAQAARRDLERERPGNTFRMPDAG